MGKNLQSMLSGSSYQPFLSDVQTPCFIYSEELLLQQAERLQNAFSWNEGFSFFVPISMNPDRLVLNVLQKAGCGVLCQSEQELKLAESCGFSGRQILFAAFAPNEKLQHHAAALHAIFVIDGLHAVPQFPIEQAILSVKSKSPLRHQGLVYPSNAYSKFGMPEEELLQAAQQLQKNGTKLGLIYFGSDCELDVRYPAVLLDELLQGSVYLQEQGIDVDTLCISGPPAVSCRSSIASPAMGEIAHQIKERLIAWKTAHPNTSFRMMLCPGRFLLSRQGILLTRVSAIKEQHPPLVIMDLAGTQMLHLLQPGVHHEVAALSEEEPSVIYELSGCLMDGRDYFRGRRFLPKMCPGDLLCIQTAGAFGAGFCSAYGGFEPPKRYLLCADGSILPTAEIL